MNIMKKGIAISLLAAGVAVCFVAGALAQQKTKVEASKDKKAGTPPRTGSPSNLNRLD
jgi:hypothetical protein